jgi:hypothetical protein
LNSTRKSQPSKKAQENKHQSKKASGKPTLGKWNEVNRKQLREMMRKMQSENLSLEVVHPRLPTLISATNPGTWPYRRAATPNRCDF